MKTIEAEFVSPRGIQPIFGIGTTTVYARIAAGDFRAVKMGAKTLVEVDSVRAYLAGLPRLPARHPERAAA